MVGKRLDYRIKNRAFRAVELETRDRRSTANGSLASRSRGQSFSAQGLVEAASKRLANVSPSAAFESPTTAELR